MRSKTLFLIIVFLAAAVAPATADSAGTVTVDVHPSATQHAETAKLWMPYPLSGEFQKTSDTLVVGNYTESAV